MTHSSSEAGAAVATESYSMHIEPTMTSAAESRDSRLSAPTIPLEALAYIGLALLALVLRFADLDIAPMTDAEAEGALPAWRAIEDDAPGGFMTSSSPLTHLSQLVSFTLVGASEFTARLGAALAGAALALTPLLFREHLGKTRAFVWSVLLTLLTMPLVMSRNADGVAFMMLFCVLTIWMIRRYWYSRRLADAFWAIACLSFMTLLSSPSGIPLLAIMLVAGWLAVWRTALSAPQRLGLPGDDILQLAFKRLRDFPIARAAFVPVLIVFLTSTAFMLYPAGLRTASQLLNDAISGITQSGSLDGTRLGFVALIAYEPLLLIFALGGAWLLWKKGDITYIDRFAAAWAAIGAFALLLYPGAGATDAMWVALPLTLLASYGITQLMVDRRVVILWAEDEEDSAEGALYSPRYRWVKWAISAGVFMFLIALSAQFMQVARLLLELPAGASPAEFFPLLLESSPARLLPALGLLLMTAIIALIVFLLTANFWGLGTCLQGVGLGFLWLMLFSGLGGAINGSMADSTHPRALWRQSALAADAYLLRETLIEMANRRADGAASLEVVVARDDDGIAETDGAVAWLLRDFAKARFVNTAAEASGAAIVLMAADEAREAALQGDYVGQRFALRQNWSFAELSLWDWPAWWTQGRLREAVKREDRLMLWLRQDVYDGVSQDRAPQD